MNTCPTCQQKIASRTERLTPGLCKVLVKMYQAKGSRLVHLQRDVSLTRSEYCNANKLKLFGLIQSADSFGHWQITTKGIEFLNGSRINKHMLVEGRGVSPADGQMATITEILKTRPYWMQREEYSATVGGVDSVLGPLFQ